MIEILNFLKGITPGGVGIWTLVCIVLWGMWKELPAVLNAWENRISKEAERTDREIERLERQISAADARHSECMEGQQKLRDEIDRLNKVIDGLIRQFRQLQISAVRVGADAEPPMIQALLSAIDKPVTDDLPPNGKGK